MQQILVNNKQDSFIFIIYEDFNQYNLILNVGFSAFKKDEHGTLFKMENTRAKSGV